MGDPTICTAVSIAAAVPVGTIRDDGLSEFLQVRPRLFGIACRILRSVGESEDVVQDVWVRWQTTDRSQVRNPLAFLATTTTRLAINLRLSARARKETCPGTSLPEKVSHADPTQDIERHEALDAVAQLLLERLSAMECAAYVLREGFNYSYRELAQFLRLEEANARQLVTRARRNLSGRRRAPVSPADKQRMLQAFVEAARSGDLSSLTRLFRPVVTTQRRGRSLRC